MLLTGSAGGGKSRLCSEKMHAYCLHYPGAVGIALRKAREYASKSVVFALKAAIGDEPRVHYKSSEMIFYYANDSKIFIAGLSDEKQRQAVRSINGNGSADIIWAEEANAFEEADHNELLARLRGNAAPWRQIMYSTNPDRPIHWIKRRLIDNGEADVYYSRAADNVYNPAEYLETLDSLTGVSHDRLARGLWVQAEGVVFPQFREDLHVIDPFPIPNDWRRFLTIDFGYTNPFVCQWWAVDHDGRLYRYREIYRTKRLVSTHARDIVKHSGYERIEVAVCDHDAEDRATLIDPNPDNVSLANIGVATTPAKKAKSLGLQKLANRLKPAGDGKPRIFFFRNSLVEIDPSLEAGYKPTCTEQEFSGYVWPMGVDGRPNKEEPIKENDHGIDAARYATMYVDQDTASPEEILSTFWG